MTHVLVVYITSMSMFFFGGCSTKNQDIKPQTIPALRLLSWTGKNPSVSSKMAMKEIPYWWFQFHGKICYLCWIVQLQVPCHVWLPKGKNSAQYPVLLAWSCYVQFTRMDIWLVVSTPLKNISQIGSSSQQNRGSHKIPWFQSPPTSILIIDYHYQPLLTIINHY